MLKYLRWGVCFPVSWFFTFLTWFFSPVLALPQFVTIDKNNREQLVKWLHWFQTFDAPLDEWRVGTYWQSCNWLKWDWTKPTHRYLARLFWLCRNPAYGFGQFPLGLDPVGTPVVTTKEGTWDSGSDNKELTTWDNGFTYRGQKFFYKNIMFRVYIGWKHHGGYDRYMLATHFSIRSFKTPA
jgi:hypothetical protein